MMRRSGGRWATRAGAGVRGAPETTTRSFGASDTFALRMTRPFTVTRPAWSIRRSVWRFEVGWRWLSQVRTVCSVGSDAGTGWWRRSEGKRSRLHPRSRDPRIVPDWMERANGRLRSVPPSLGREYVKRLTQPQ